MCRLAALEAAQALLGPRGYADYRWVGNGDPPRCVIGTLHGLTFTPRIEGSTFEEALAQVRATVRR